MVETIIPETKMSVRKSNKTNKAFLSIRIFSPFPRNNYWCETQKPSAKNWRILCCKTNEKPDERKEKDPKNSDLNENRYCCINLRKILVNKFGILEKPNLLQYVCLRYKYIWE